MKQNYPHSVLANLVQNDNTLISSFFDTLIGQRATSIIPDVDDNICDTESSYIAPRAANNKAGKFMFIVNHPEGFVNYLQQVKVTTCLADGDQCAQGQLLGSISTRCKQEYSDHKLVALSESGEELVVDTFSFPSCCSCVFDNQLELRSVNT